MREIEDYDDILALPVVAHDTEAATIKEYLRGLLLTLWDEQEGFSGKRPYGNSGWAYDLYKPLIKAGYIAGELDEYDDINECDTDAGDKIIRETIEALCS